MTNKIITILTFLFLFVSCQGEQVELAQLSFGEKVSIEDHSPVYLFFRTIEIDTVLDINRKNTIASTNWIFHVDKRFMMKQVVDDITKLQVKKDNSPHKRADAKNFYSFMDNSTKTLSFFDFTDIKYSYPNYFSTQYIKENPDYHLYFENFSIDFKNINSVSINGFNMPFEELESYINETLSMTKSSKKALVYMNFNNKINFEDYLNIWQSIKRFDNSLIEISPVHFVYDELAIEDCGCK